MHINQPLLGEMARRFLFDQLNPDPVISSDDVELDECPNITSKVFVYHSATATFYAPSDFSGIRGMKKERIRSTPSFHKYRRHDCAFAVVDQDQKGFSGLGVVRILLFFSFEFHGVKFPCALVEWFKKHGRSPDKKTGMWIVKPEYSDGQRLVSVLHVDMLLRNAHLLPVFGNATMPHGFHFSHSLDCFKAFYVSKYADHHMYELMTQ